MEIEEINYMETLKVKYTEAGKGKNFLGDTITACTYLKDIYVSKEKMNYLGWQKPDTIRNNRMKLREV